VWLSGCRVSREGIICSASCPSSRSLAHERKRKVLIEKDSPSACPPLGLMGCYVSGVMEVGEDLLALKVDTPTRGRPPKPLKLGPPER
jgi:hypothetical protein